ncbi:hypothetical protein BJ912DRAFT_1063103 [Pholiota molesta]|nr:hypothetical protein BJ912DRAFT_1063103 [Pholiota molesta]
MILPPSSMILPLQPCMIGYDLLRPNANSCPTIPSGAPAPRHPPASNVLLLLVPRPPTTMEPRHTRPSPSLSAYLTAYHDAYAPHRGLSIYTTLHPCTLAYTHTDLHLALTRLLAFHRRRHQALRSAVGADDAAFRPTVRRRDYSHRRLTSCIRSRSLHTHASIARKSSRDHPKSPTVPCEAPQSTTTSRRSTPRKAQLHASAQYQREQPSNSLHLCLPRPASAEALVLATHPQRRSRQRTTSLDDGGDSRR